MTSIGASEDLKYKIADVKRQVQTIEASIDAGLLAVAEQMLLLSQTEKDLLVSERAVKFMKNEADMVALKDFRKQLLLIERQTWYGADLKLKISVAKKITDNQGGTVMLLRKMLTALENELVAEDKPLTNLIKFPVRAI